MVSYSVTGALASMTTVRFAIYALLTTSEGVIGIWHRPEGPSAVEA